MPQTSIFFSVVTTSLQPEVSIRKLRLESESLSLYSITLVGLSTGFTGLKVKLDPNLRNINHIIPKPYSDWVR